MHALPQQVDSVRYWQELYRQPLAFWQAALDHILAEHQLASSAWTRAELGRTIVFISPTAVPGGFGMIGGTSPGGADWLRAQIRAARARTSRPFGVGFISSFAGTDDLIQVALDEQVAAINHSFADPAPYVAAAHGAGVKVFAQVQTVAQAQGAARAGVDVIIAQGRKPEVTQEALVRSHWCRRWLMLSAASRWSRRAASPMGAALRRP